ncbi:MAG: NERD domain-containing protein [Candidatus Poribacteria bacterium]|nr:NERD domain-containing protein [Candidatus Poribacteria bacterium]
MQQRIIDPPKDQWHRLPTPLTSGENKVYNLFDAGLPPDWEMYIQPHLNGLRPDLVLLNPYTGIAVFEIKDWSLNTLESSIKYNWATQSPINQIKLYEDEIFNLYCPGLDDQFGKAVISAGLIFTQISQAMVDRLLNPFRDGNMGKFPEQYPFAGSEGLEERNIDVLFPENKKWGQHKQSHYMSEDTANDLRGWLKEPAFSKEQREPLKLDSRQLTIATEPPEKRYRQVRGPAGSGKSQALAARAAVLGSEGKRVLVCPFNITLMNYLRDIVARYARELATQQGRNPRVIKKQVEFRHFHGWCKWVCALAGRVNDYSQLWRPFTEETEEAVLEEQMAKLVSKIYTDLSGRDVLPIYDAILVDEGQDYNKDWWQTLRAAVKPYPDGEMLLVADKTQNIYGKDLTWLGGSLSGTGFSSREYNLETSYRLPPEIIPILEDFANRFLVPSGVEVDIPKQVELGFNPPIELRWVQVSSVSSIAEICFEEAFEQMKCLRDDTAIPDIIFLTARNDTGLAFVEKCKEKKVDILYTFGQGDSGLRKHENSRRKKLAFFHGSAKFKATTLHSFKGWEGRHLILYVSRIVSAEDRALFYMALTRLKTHPNGSMLTVVSSCPELSSFGERNFSPNFFPR